MHINMTLFPLKAKQLPIQFWSVAQVFASVWKVQPVTRLGWYSSVRKPLYREATNLWTLSNNSWPTHHRSINVPPPTYCSVHCPETPKQHNRMIEDTLSSRKRRNVKCALILKYCSIPVLSLYSLFKDTGRLSGTLLIQNILHRQTSC